jgi:hypothetical protein
MKPSSEFIAHAEGSAELTKKMSTARSADELVKLANDAGFGVDKNTLSSLMRSIAGAELQKRGFPEWAINSVFLGETVCW